MPFGRRGRPDSAVGFDQSLTAVADEFVLAHPVGHAHEGTTLAVLGSAALYLLGNLLFKWAIFGRLRPAHVVGLVVLGGAWLPAGELPANMPAVELKRGGDERVIAAVRMALINHGVDLMRGHSGFVSTAHTASDIEATVVAFAAAVDDVVQER